MNFSLNNENIDDAIAEFEYVFRVKLHNIEKFSLQDLEGISWIVIWIDRKNAILISSKSLLEFQTWHIFTNKYYILLPNVVIQLN